MENISFLARARTLDHLGREQIADCPTAISELWKNAYDAYARQVNLDLFDGDPIIAVLSDDGHGMNKLEFTSKWLVVGTEAKATNQLVPAVDRNGLKERQRQGQKGIGRLSCANLGPTMLLVTKRANAPFVVSLIDWRLFENPFLLLGDVVVPVMEHVDKEGIFSALPEMVSQLNANFADNRDQERAKRLDSAWNSDETTRNLANSIRTSLERIGFEERHIENWPVWQEECNHGTAMLVSELNFDLRMQIERDREDASALSARDRFFETLSNFVDPYLLDGTSSNFTDHLQFEYAVRVWHGATHKTVIGTTKEFERNAITGLEHQIDGMINANGEFSGRVKAFGKWLDGNQEINPPDDLHMPKRKSSKVGPFRLSIASMEVSQSNSTHPPKEFTFYKDLADRYAGVMMFRDGLRVLPYGRTDNDYFKIDDRRSRQAGREFWNNRRMFGRVAISKTENPNLRNKTGQEGLIDNRAAKVLRELVIHILRESAKRYFGTVSGIRKAQLPEIRKSNAERKAKENREKLRRKNESAFQQKLVEVSAEIPMLVEDVSKFAQGLDVRSEQDIEYAQNAIENYRERLSMLALPIAPKQVGALGTTYEQYRTSYRTTRNLLNETSTKLAKCIEKVSPKDPIEIVCNQIKRGNRAYVAFLNKKKEEVTQLQESEQTRVSELHQNYKRKFSEETDPILQRLESGLIDLPTAVKQVDTTREFLHQLVADIFGSYSSALEILHENIDLDYLIRFGIDESEDLRSERDRLTSLAQLGIAVEISGHELQEYDDLIAGAFARLPDGIKELRAVKDIELGVEGLTDQLRFLSPIRIAGQRSKSTITGNDIYSYVKEFFRRILSRCQIKFEASEKFLAMSVYDLPSRLFPVFINLVNNSIYWLTNADQDHRSIVFDVVGDEIVISDNGPGVESEYIDDLFTLFFTRKLYGGRGVGLYLARASLMATGHSIRYESDSTGLPLGGANFLIKFLGARFD